MHARTRPRGRAESSCVCPQEVFANFLAVDPFLFTLDLPNNHEFLHWKPHVSARAFFFPETPNQSAREKRS